MVRLALVVFSLLFLAGASAKVYYHGEQVIDIVLDGPSEFRQIQFIMQQQGDHDVWSHDGIFVSGHNHLRVKNTTAQLISKHFEFNVLIEDVQRLIDESEAEHNTADNVGAFFDNYRRYAEIVAELKRLAAAYPNLSKFVPSIGKSIEGRDIPAIYLGASGFKNATAQRIFFQGGQHAREWIGPATVMYQTAKFLEQYGKDATITTILNNLEIVIVPLSNPDGYEYAHTNERLWRKNRRKNTGGTFGVDLNRNWNEHWGGSGSSGTPSSDTYRGTAAFSEPESLLVSKFISENNKNNNILTAIDFHSYSQLVLRPYGWTTAKCPDETALKIIGDGISYEISRTSGLRYTSQRSIDLYITTGTASDWYYQEGIWGAYTIELRDTGAYGFVLPPAQIIPTGEEILASMKYFALTVLDTHP